ncbi:MAG: CHAT domain-containing protein [Aureispira sp.]|nr:CHAT domain-containing protein [Aureispira sp.]
MKRLITCFVIMLILGLNLHAQDDFSKYSIDQLDSLFIEYKFIETFDKLLPCALEAFHKVKAQSKEQDTTYARILSQVGYAYDYGEEDFDKAIMYYNQSINLYKRLGVQSITYGHTLFCLGQIRLYTENNIEEAEPLYLEYLRIIGLNVEKEHHEYFYALANLGGFYGDIEEYDKANSYYDKLVKLIPTSKVKQDVYYVIALRQTAELYQDMDLLDQAESIYLTALEIVKKLNGHTANTEHLILLNNLGHIYRKKTKHKETELILYKAKSIAESKPELNPLLHTNILNNLAILYQDLGRYEQAITSFQQAIKVIESMEEKDISEYASSLNNLAVLYMNMHEYAKAKKILLKVTHLFKNTHGEQSIYYGLALLNLASAYFELEDYSKAEEINILAKKILKLVLGPTHSNYLQAVSNLGLIYVDVKQYDKAEVLLKNVLTTQIQINGKESLPVARTFNILSRLYLHSNNLNISEEMLKQAFDGISPDLDSSIVFTLDFIQKLQTKRFYNNERGIDCLGTLHRLFLKKYHKKNQYSDLQMVYTINQTTMKMIESFRTSFSAKKDKLRLLKRYNFFAKNAMMAAQEMYRLNPSEDLIKEMFKYSEQNKSVLLSQALKAQKNNGLGKIPDNIIEEEKGLQKQLAKVKKQLLQGKGDKVTLLAEQNKLNEEIEQFRQKLESNHPKYYKYRYQNTTIKVEEIQKLLKPKTALLEFFVADTVIYLYYIDQKQIKIEPISIASGVCKKQINTLRKVLTNYRNISKNKSKGYQLYTKTAHWFYNTLLKKTLEDTENINHLIFVTDGELGHLPFETFLVEPSTDSIGSYSDLHYLLNDYEISYAYSATLLKENQDNSKQQVSNKMLAMAASYSKAITNENLDYRSPLLLNLRKALQPLPSAEKEVEALEKLFEGVFGLKENATEKKFKEDVSNYGIIHLAMHGILNKQYPILSSLAFTEDSDSLEDNFLEAHEISQLQLNAGLVVLSACETGYGEFEQGEGTISLARSFMYAGVPSLIVSLWQVNDQSTSMIMQNFYQHLSTGLNKSEALRQAKLDYLKNAKGIAAHPAFWSPFIQLGDSQPIALAKKGSSNWIGWLVGGSLILLLGFLGRILLKKRAKLEV